MAPPIPIIPPIVVVNPYLKKNRATTTTDTTTTEGDDTVVADTVANTGAGGEGMGPQSQTRVNQIVRAGRLAQHSSSNKRQKTGGATKEFIPLRDCLTCKNKEERRLDPSVAEYKKGHHDRCPNAPKNRKKALDNEPEFSYKYLPKKGEGPAASAAFFGGRRKASKGTTVQRNMAVPDAVQSKASGKTFCEGVNAMLQDQHWCRDIKKKCRAPLAMSAFAKVVEDTIIKKKEWTYFDGLTITVPACPDMYDSPQYHSIVGQKLLLVDWIRLFGMELDCPHCEANNRVGKLKNNRTNFSKNKQLMPIFGLDGAPQWCMFQYMQCTTCRVNYSANDGEILARLPLCAAEAHPVESKYAVSAANNHLGRSATDVLDLLMTTYGNGDLCSRMLLDAVNREYKQKVANYYTYPGKRAKPYIQKDGEFISTNAFPPLGATLRTTFDKAASSNNVPWKISDHDRNTREIQGVGCSTTTAEDTTFEVRKNYDQYKSLGIEGCWNQTGDGGQIACAVLVDSTKTTSIAHAAKQLSLRDNFKPKALYNDRWPIKVDFWKALYGEGLPGRLGLFHYLQRIIKTLRKTHSNYWKAMNRILFFTVEGTRQNDSVTSE